MSSPATPPHRRARRDRIRAVPVWDHIRTGARRPPRLRLPDGFSLSENGTAARATIWFDDVNLVGLFEPVETREDFRRLGLARAVMTEGLHRMRAAGCAPRMVEHDITNAPAAGLYESLGFTVAYETVGFRVRGRSGRRLSRAG